MSYISISNSGNVQLYNQWSKPKEADESDLISCNTFIGHIFREIFGTLLCGLVQKSDVYIHEHEGKKITLYLNHKSAKNWENIHENQKIANVFKQKIGGNNGGSGTSGNKGSSSIEKNY